MELKDLLVTPIYLFLIFGVAYFVRPFFTDRINRKYFLPALGLKVIGGLALGLIYQFYYGGGDTFTYFHLGSKYIWQAFLENPMAAIKLIFAGMDYSPDTFQYASKIYTYGDPSSYFVVRVAGIFDLFTFHTYSATAVLFSVVSFTGIWAMFLAFYRQFPSLHKYLAIACFFIPSVFFWGSGILKDSLTIGALGWATFSIYKIFFDRDKVILYVLILLFSFYVIYTIKIYILLCFVPAALFWVFYNSIRQIRNVIIRLMIIPFVIAITLYLGYFSVKKIGEDNPRYNLENIAYTAEETARWIHYVSERQGGSAYSLGDFDFSPTGMVKKFPMAVWVTLYRPYLWESNNIVMLLSAFESLALLFLTAYIIYKSGWVRFFKLATSQPILIFCFLFSIMFSFAVGLTTYNFGSLVRYKIPMLPFMVAGLFIAYHYSKSEKKRARLAPTE